ncbi:DUF262 domain-containing protein [Bacteroides sp. D20]|jgi:hypothetical protein|uniref:DUF262 domain-containing protein n=1 Tax=Bacteroides sp. D20 TaxID=585543 RepID=UPI000E44DB25|nr:DUF262 domain-containing protein [Bacteroides sp. D20]RGJ03057.1 DUF262 domain-containing protein [Bacteroides sp. D20]
MCDIENRNIETEIIIDNQSDSEDIQNIDISDVVVYARDWTIETIFNQINIGNIDLNPKFQRRNAWNDDKRSKLIESIIMGYPVPEIVLAENPNKKRSFIVIDGKQRLLTLAGFIDNEKYKYWDRPVLKGLKVLKELNRTKYIDLDDKSKREFDNSSLRCTVITNFKDIQILYDIFYRLNSGSESLSTQELRQALNRGKFADYLVEITNTLQPIHSVMNLSEPDKRFRDIEILLRLFAFIKYPKEYKGNLKRFLDEKMGEINSKWAEIDSEIMDQYEKINSTINLLKDIFGDYKFIGRKYDENDFSNRFNKVLFEVEVFYFLHLDDKIIEHKQNFIDAFKELCLEDIDFRSSIESSTKNIENYKIRYTKFQDLINNSFGLNLSINPFL